MLNKNEPDWIEHDGSDVRPVPAGHDVEVRDRLGMTYRSRGYLSTWRLIAHYRDWTAFEQQQTSAGEVPKLLTEAEWRELLSTAWVDPDEKLPELRERGLIAPEPEPDALREVVNDVWSNTISRLASGEFKVSEAIGTMISGVNFDAMRDALTAELRARGVTAPAPAR